MLHLNQKFVSSLHNLHNQLRPKLQKHYCTNINGPCTELSSTIVLQISSMILIKSIKTIIEIDRGSKSTIKCKIFSTSGSHSTISIVYIDFL